MVDLRVVVLAPQSENHNLDQCFPIAGPREVLLEFVILFF